MKLRVSVCYSWGGDDQVMLPDLAKYFRRISRLPRTGDTISFSPLTPIQSMSGNDVDLDLNTFHAVVTRVQVSNIAPAATIFLNGLVPPQPNTDKWPREVLRARRFSVIFMLRSFSEGDPLIRLPMLEMIIRKNLYTPSVGERISLAGEVSLENTTGTKVGALLSPDLVVEVVIFKSSGNQLQIDFKRA